MPQNCLFGSARGFAASIAKLPNKFWDTPFTSNIFIQVHSAAPKTQRTWLSPACPVIAPNQTTLQVATRKLVGTKDCSIQESIIGIRISPFSGEFTLKALLRLAAPRKIDLN